MMAKITSADTAIEVPRQAPEIMNFFKNVMSTKVSINFLKNKVYRYFSFIQIAQDESSRLGLDSDEILNCTLLKCSSSVAFNGNNSFVYFILTEKRLT